MINLVIDILKANSTLTALVPSTRIYPLIQLQGGTIPAVVVQLVSTNPNDTQDRVSEYDDNAVQITSIADNPAQAWAISEAVRAAIDGYTGGSIAQIRFQSQATDIFEGTEVFSVTQGYSCHLKRDVGTLPIAIAGLGEFYLNDIADVDTTGVTDGQVLTYDAATNSWLAEDGSVVAALGDLTDVTISTPANNQVLLYNEAGPYWQNSLLSLQQLSDVTNELGDALDRQALVYDEATNQWIHDGVGQVVIPVRNPSRDTSIAVGTVLKATGAQGDRILVAPFEPATDDMKYFVGIASEVLGATNDTKDGHAQVYGELRAINTDAFEVGDVLYAAAGGTLSTTENQYPIAIVTRKQQDTGRIFIRMWTPGKGYHQRYRTQASAKMFVGVGATVELYYTATADGDGFVTQDLTAAVGEGNVEERVLRYKSGAFGDTTVLDYTDAGIATDATYAEMLTAFNNLLATESAPITIYATRTEVADRSGLLADYPGAAAAYSLRLLDTDYAGSAIRVRRASDNAEQDIGFDGNGDLDTTALATFCSGTDGLVKTWYDQSGNANDATQTTTGSQPKIYDSVTGVVTENGKPAITGVANGGLAFNTISVTNHTVSLVGVFNDGDIMVGGGNSYTGFIEQNKYATRNSTSQKYEWSGPTIGSQTLYVQSVNNYAGTLHNNGSQMTIVTNNITSGQWDYYGILNFIDRFSNTVQEIILYSSDQSSNRTGIESNINTYYSIYS